MSMDWFTEIPYPIQWAIVIIAGLAILGAISIPIIAICKRVKLKFWAIEATPPQEDEEKEEVKK